MAGGGDGTWPGSADAVPPLASVSARITMPHEKSRFKDEYLPKSERSSRMSIRSGLTSNPRGYKVCNAMAPCSSAGQDAKDVPLETETLPSRRCGGSNDGDDGRGTAAIGRDALHDHPQHFASARAGARTESHLRHASQETRLVKFLGTRAVPRARIELATHGSSGHVLSNLQMRA